MSSSTNFDNAVTKDSIKYIDKVGELYAIALETLISFMMNELYTQQDTMIDILMQAYNSRLHHSFFSTGELRN